MITDALQNIEGAIARMPASFQIRESTADVMIDLMKVSSILAGRELSASDEFVGWLRL